MNNTSVRLVRLLTIVALLAMMLFAGVPLASAAPIEVDDFNQITDSLLVAATPSTSPQFGSTVHGSILGGERDVQVIVTAGGSLDTIVVNPSDSSGYYSHSQVSSLRGRSIITWDGIDGSATVNPTGLGGIDLTLTGNNAFILGIISQDVPAQMAIRVYSSATSCSIRSISVPGPVAQYALLFTYSSFVQDTAAGCTSPANFGSVGAVQAIVNNAPIPAFDLDVRIDFFRATNSQTYRDMGDLPDSYTTLLASNGPVHYFDTLFLGAVVDGESDGQPTSSANGDNLNDIDDEEGVARLGTWSNGTAGGQVRVTVSGASTACLSGWIDFGQDGSFAEPGDQIFDLRNVSGGVNDLSFDIPAGTFPGPGGNNVTLNGRFRLVEDRLLDMNCTSQTNGGPEPDLLYEGPYMNGEIEDHQWPFGPTAVTLNSLQAEASTAPIVPVALLGGTALVTLGVVFFARRRKTA